MQFVKKNSKTPKYCMRKLSIGLVSCLLGFSIIIQPFGYNNSAIRSSV